MRRDGLHNPTIDLFSTDEELDSKGYIWPTADRFPLNIDRYSVKDVVIPDLKESKSPLLLTGFTGLDQLMDFCCEDYSFDTGNQVRILIGHEPFSSRRETFSVNRNDLTAEAEAYWLERGISLVYSAKVIKMIELLKQGKIQTRFVPGSKRLHAKIYLGDHAATVGSSNYTYPGLEGQIEANARFTQAKDTKRFEELRSITENYWTLGRNYRDQLIALLEKLLKVVTWQEALARACAELLEGEWAEKYLRGTYLAGSGSLWPSQKQGIAQALSILSNQGSVLIADATGAGKTRMGTYLIGALQDHIVRSGRIRQGTGLMICPPSVEANWEGEAIQSGVALKTFSHGKLSSQRAKGHGMTLDALRRAQILCVDEGHNFLNFKSQRTQQLLRNMADHVMLLTATPINKSVIDLLRMVDMLGADNLSDSILKAFKKMLGTKNLNRQLSEEELEELRKEIRRFTVRRTKRQLNRLVDRNPEAYKDVKGNKCRFPKHNPKTYPLNEPKADRDLARQVRELADGFYGVTHFVNLIYMPEILKRQGLTEEQYLKGRLKSAKKLARYLVMSSLRSSRAALMEHIDGTDKAIDFYKLSGFTKQAKSGNITEQIIRITDKLPEKELHIDLPVWLSDVKEHTKACEHDLKLYEEILKCVKKMSDTREKAKAELLCKLLKSNNLLLAFDSRPISLAYIDSLISGKTGIETHLAWGSAGSDRGKVIEDFAFGSKKKNIIALCSDSMSEGLNLQQASCMVHLDMPSVVRVAEQRAGRVDRMDSPHKQIEVFWPEDADEFALTSDERFIERYETVEQLLGSNMPLPDSMKNEKPKIVKPDEIIKAAEEEQSHWDGIDDAYAPIRSIIEGDKAIIPYEIYEKYRHITHKILSRVSLVKSKSPWALFCLTAGSFEAPTWVMVTGLNGDPATELSEICLRLRERLSAGVEDMKLDERTAKILNHFLSKLSLCERKLLAKKKQRALDELETILIKLMRITKNEKTIEHLIHLEKMLKNPLPHYQPDWDTVASKWLDVIRPVWFERLSSKRSKPLLLADIRKDLLDRPDWLIKQIEKHFKEFPLLQKPDERIKACIIGVS